MQQPNNTPRKKQELPEWLKNQYTQRQWKALKRKEFKAVMKAFGIFFSGCAYTPAKGLGLIREQLKGVEKAMSVKEWGR